jgi:hypothetical protein
LHERDCRGCRRRKSDRCEQENYNGAVRYAGSGEHGDDVVHIGFFSSLIFFVTQQLPCLLGFVLEQIALNPGNASESARLHAASFAAQE